MSLEELKPKTKKLVERFKDIEPRRWSVEGSIMELMTEIGDLTELVLRKEYYKENVYDDVDFQIRDELADIIFVVIRLADHYGVNLDQAYSEMLESVSNRLSNKGV